MISKKTLIKYTSVVMVAIVIVYISSSLLIKAKFSEIERNIRDHIYEQEGLLSTIAEVTARNGADTVTESIVKDCPVGERSQFDDLLGKLGSGLTQGQLVELERLFGRCGSFYSERKSVMVARLSREIEIYEDYVDQLENILDKDLEAEFPVTLWKELAIEEKKQSELFVRLVAVQDQIIKTLLSGKSSDSPEIKNILQENKEIKETLFVAKEQSSEIRDRLIAL